MVRMVVKRSGLRTRGDVHVGRTSVGRSWRGNGEGNAGTGTVQDVILHV